MSDVKALLLAHYAEKEPTDFEQIDCHHRSGAIVDAFPECRHDAYDADGDTFDFGATTELMNGADVRILVRRDTPLEVATRLLRKAADWSERDGLEVLP